MLVAMEIFGLHEYIKDVTRRLAKFAAFAVAPDNKKAAEFKIYPGAPHGFRADYRASYRKEVADDAWPEMQAWYKKNKVLG